MLCTLGARITYDDAIAFADSPIDLRPMIGSVLKARCLAHLDTMTRSPKELPETKPAQLYILRTR